MNRQCNPWVRRILVKGGPAPRPNSSLPECDADARTNLLPRSRGSASGNSTHACRDPFQWRAATRGRASGNGALYRHEFGRGAHSPKSGGECDGFSPFGRCVYGRSRSLLRRGKVRSVLPTRARAARPRACPRSTAGAFRRAGSALRRSPGPCRGRSPTGRARRARISRRGPVARSRWRVWSVVIIRPEAGGCRPKQRERLDQISVQALAVAQQILGSTLALHAGRSLESLTVDVELDPGDRRHPSRGTAGGPGTGQRSAAGAGRAVITHVLYVLYLTEFWLRAAWDL